MTGWEKRSACVALVQRLIDEGTDRADAQRRVVAMFYPDVPRGLSRHYGIHLYAPAKLVCASCPVRAECLADALATGDFHGVRAGLDPYQLLDLMGYQGRIPA